MFERNVEKINSFAKAEDFFPEFDETNAVVVKDVGYQHADLFRSLFKSQGIELGKAFVESL